MDFRGKLEKYTLKIIGHIFLSIYVVIKWCLFIVLACFIYANFSWTNVPGIYEGNFLCGDDGIPMSIHGSKISLASYDYDVNRIEGTDIKAYNREIFIPFLGWRDFQGREQGFNLNTISINFNASSLQLYVYWPGYAGNKERIDQYKCNKVN